LDVAMRGAPRLRGRRARWGGARCGRWGGACCRGRRRRLFGFAPAPGAGADQRADDQNRGALRPHAPRAYQTALQLFQFALTLRHPNSMSVAGCVCPAPRAACAPLVPGSALTGPTQAGLRVTVTLVAALRLAVAGLVVTGLSCAHVEATPCGGDTACKPHRLCDAS